MANVTESFATVNFDALLTDTRTFWRQCVAHVAAKAQAALPACNARVEKAVALVLGGNVEMLGDGTARVASQSDGVTQYHIVNGHCDCLDYPQAHQGWCKHRLGHAIAKRATALMRSKLTLDLDPETLATS